MYDARSAYLWESSQRDPAQSRSIKNLDTIRVNSMFNFVPSNRIYNLSLRGGVNWWCRIAETWYQSNCSRLSWSKSVKTARYWWSRDVAFEGIKRAWNHVSNVAKWWSSRVSMPSGLSHWKCHASNEAGRYWTKSTYLSSERTDKFWNLHSRPRWCFIQMSCKV